jgi:hypothetical protein
MPIRRLQGEHAFHGIWEFLFTILNLPPVLANNIVIVSEVFFVGCAFVLKREISIIIKWNGYTL